MIEIWPHLASHLLKVELGAHIILLDSWSLLGQKWDLYCHIACFYYKIGGPQS